MRLTRVLLAAAAVAAARPAGAAPALGPDFTSAYTLADLGAPPGVPADLGGLAFDPADASRLLVLGKNDLVDGALYAIRVVRTPPGRISGFDGAATLVASASEAHGGMAFGPGGLLIVVNALQDRAYEYLPGSAAPDQTILLQNLGFSTGPQSIVVAPSWAPGWKQLKLSDGLGRWWRVPYTVDADGTWTLTAGTIATTLAQGGYSQGAAYVPPGSPLFAAPAVLIGERTTNAVAALDVDGAGDLGAPASRRVFLQGLTSASGMAIDPVTGDLLVATYQNLSTILVVRGFAAPPTFHAARVVEVYAGAAGSQFVELADPDAEAFDGSAYDLVVYDAGGARLGSVPLDPARLAARAAAGRPFLVATAAAETAFAVTADARLDVELPAAAGQACYQNGATVVHCLTWGAVATAVPPTVAAASAGPPPPASQSLSCHAPGDRSCGLAAPTPGAPNPEVALPPDAGVADARPATADAAAPADAPPGPSPSSGGCSVAGSGRPPWLALAILALALVRRRATAAAPFTGDT